MDVDTILDTHFVAVSNTDPMQRLAEIKSTLKRKLPPDSTIELTMLMNSVVLNVYVPGDRRYVRTLNVQT
jgi:hypothetical protein